MTKYKGLSVPNIVKEHIDISEVFNTNCVLTKFSSVGDSGHYQRPDYQKINVCSRISNCENCVMNLDNITIGLEYLCEYNYISAEERLQIALDHGV